MTVLTPPPPPRIPLRERAERVVEIESGGEKGEKNY